MRVEHDLLVNYEILVFSNDQSEMKTLNALPMSSVVRCQLKTLQTVVAQLQLRLYLIVSSACERLSQAKVPSLINFYFSR